MIEIMGMYELIVALTGMVMIFGLYRMQKNASMNSLEPEVIALGPGDEENEEEIYELLWDKEPAPASTKTVKKINSQSHTLRKEKARKVKNYIKASRKKVRWAERRLLLYSAVCKPHTRLKALKVCRDLANHDDLTTRKHAREVLQVFATADCLRNDRNLRERARKIIVAIYPNMAESLDLAA